MRNPGADLLLGRAEAIPFPDDAFDLVAAQLVLHFVSDAQAVAGEFRRVTRPGGFIGACVWDSAQNMQMLRAFWDAALDLDPDAPDESRHLRFSRAGEIAQLFSDAGLADIVEATLEVSTTYESFDELWNGFKAGIGPVGAYCVNLSDDHQTKLRDRLNAQLGHPAGSFTLRALARTATATSPK